MSHRVKEREKSFILSLFSLLNSVWNNINNIRKIKLYYLSLTPCETTPFAKFIKKEHVPKDFDKGKFKIDLKQKEEHLVELKNVIK